MPRHRIIPILGTLAVLVLQLGLAGSADARVSRVAASPSVVTAPTISGSAIVGETLSASTGAWIGSPTGYTYAWLNCNRKGKGCSTLLGATDATYVLTVAEAGRTVRVLVRAWNPSGSTSATSAQTSMVSMSSTADTTAPSVPSALAAADISSSGFSSSWAASTDAVGVVGYEVRLNGLLVGTPTGTSYVFAGLACGSTYTVSVLATDAAGNRSAEASLAVATAGCAAVAPSVVSPPVVSGTARVGSLLNASSGSWSGSTPMTYAYQWLSCDGAGAGCTALVAASTASYTVVASDVDRTLRVSVTASNGGGSAGATSAQTLAVQAQPALAAGLHVSGNRLLDASENVVRFHGVNYSGPEYACIQGWGIFDGPSDDAMVLALMTWNVNVVHLGLNEDCILGINGVQAAYAGANYMNAIVAFVNRLHAHGMYAEVSLMWSAPGTKKALGHPQILNQDHSPAALAAIANAFKNDPKTIIGLQSEPHDISWACWKNGGSSCSVGYAALGMQGALNAVRNTGATNVVTASGIDWANTMTQWLANKPTDQLGQLIAEAHVYGKNGCASVSCFDTYYAPVAASVPLIFGETGETYDDSSCGSTNISTFMNWADAHGVGYEAWTWDVWGDCGSLISNFDGTPANAYGTWVRTHYLTLP